MLKMSITQTDTKVHGPAFIEVTILIIVIFDFEDSGYDSSLVWQKEKFQKKNGWCVNLEILKALLMKLSSARSQSIYIQKRN